MKKLYGAVILAGGKATRMRGLAKPELKVGDASLLERVASSVSVASARVIIGNVELDGWSTIVEEPSGAGPAYALMASLPLFPASVDTVVVLAADLPFMTNVVAESLMAALGEKHEGAVLVDPDGKRQWMCGAWRKHVLERLSPSVQEGASMRRVFGDLDIVEVRPNGEAPAWFDCDTPQDLDHAREIERAAIHRRACP